MDIEAEQREKSSLERLRRLQPRRESLDEILDAVEDHKEEFEDAMEIRNQEKGEIPASEQYGAEELEYTAGETGLRLDYKELFSYMGSGIKEDMLHHTQTETKKMKSSGPVPSGVDMENGMIDLIIRTRKMDNQSGYATSQAANTSASSSTQYRAVSRSVSIHAMEKFQLLNKMSHIFALTKIKYEMNGW